MTILVMLEGSAALAVAVLVCIHQLGNPHQALATLDPEEREEDI